MPVGEQGGFVVSQVPKGEGPGAPIFLWEGEDRQKQKQIPIAEGDRALDAGGPEAPPILVGG